MYVGRPAEERPTKRQTIYYLWQGIALLHLVWKGANKRTISQEISSLNAQWSQLGGRFEDTSDHGRVRDLMGMIGEMIA
jgi:hypothetical protein